MSEIKVFKTHTAQEGYVGTESEKRAIFEKWKAKSQIEGPLLDAFLQFDIHPQEPAELQKNNIMALQVKTLLQYMAPLFEGNPHVASLTDKPGAIWLQYDQDLIALDLSFREYRIPKDEKFRISGLQPTYRKTAGAIVPAARLYKNVPQQATNEEILAADAWGKWHPDGRLMACDLVPLPQLEAKNIIFGDLANKEPDALSPYIDDINRNNEWYLKNESLIYNIVLDSQLRPVYARIKFPEPAKVKDAILTKVEKIVIVNFLGTHAQIIADLNQVDLLDFYNRARMIGVNNPKITKDVAVINQQYRDLEDLRKHIFDSQRLRLEETLKINMAQEMYKSSYKELKAADRAKIDKLVANRNAHKMVDDADARRLMKNIKRAVESTIDSLSELERVAEDIRHQVDVPAKLPVAMLNMKKTKGKICSHYIYLVQAALKAGQNALGQYDVHSATERTVQHYAEKAAVNYRYYCSSCGELLMIDELDDFNVFGNQTVISSTSDKDPIWLYILAGVNQTMRFVRFKTARNIKNLVMATAQLLESEIESKHNELQKSKTKSMDDIFGLISLYISAYCFAFLSKMIIDNPKAMEWNVKILTPSNEEPARKPPPPSSPAKESPTPAKTVSPVKKTKAKVIKKAVAKVKKTKKKNIKGAGVDSFDSPFVTNAELYDASSESDPESLEGSPFLEELDDDTEDDTEDLEGSPFMEADLSADKEDLSADKDVKGGKEDKVGKQKAASQVLTVAYGLLISSQQSRIAKIKDFTSDNMKPILIKAYEWSRNAKFTVQRDESQDNDASEWATALNIDPFYNFTYAVNVVNHPKRETKFTDFKEVLGSVDPKTMLCSMEPYSKAWMPDVKDTTMLNQSYRSLMEYLNEKIYLEFSIPRSPRIQEFWKKWDVLLQKDEQIWRENRFALIRPSRIMYNNSKGQVPVFPKLDASVVFCPDGKRHDYSIKNLKYQYMMRKGGMKLFSFKELQDLLKEKPDALKHMTLKDELCGHCNRAKNAPPMKNIGQKLEHQTRLENFYKYFKNRCPLAELHEFPLDKQGFVGDLACKKCGFRREFTDTMPEAYYNKYKNKQPRLEFVKQDLTAHQKPFVMKKQDKWSVTMASVLQIAHVSDVDYNIWVNLGLTEHKNFNMIKQGNINPQSMLTDAQETARLTKLINYVDYVRKQYYLIKNHAKVVLPPGLKQVLEEEGGRNEHAQLSTAMPDILSDFNQKIDYYRYSNTNAKIISNFALHTLCNTLLQIRALDKIKKITHRLFTYLIEQIVAGEVMMSQLEIQKIQLATTDAKEDQLEVDDETYNELNDRKDIEDRGTEDPFSLDETDIETSNRGLDDEEFLD